MAQITYIVKRTRVKNRRVLLVAKKTSRRKTWSAVAFYRGRIVERARGATSHAALVNLAGRL